MDGFSRCAWSPLVFAVIGILVAGVVCAQNQAGNCFALKDSKSCPDFNGYGVRISRQFRNTDEFDNYINSSLDTSKAYQQRFAMMYGCDPSATLQQRYHQGFMCSYFVTQSGCNNRRLKTSEVICKKQCLQFIASTNAAFANKELCMQSPKVAIARNRSQSSSPDSEFYRFCAFIPASLKSPECSPGLKTEAEMCGFPVKSLAKAYCSQKANKAGDDCCQKFEELLAQGSVKVGNLKIQKKTLISTGAGTGGALLITGAAAIFAVRYRKKKLREREDINSKLSELDDFQPEIGQPGMENPKMQSRMKKLFSEQQSFSRAPDYLQPTGEYTNINDAGQGATSMGTSGIDDKTLKSGRYTATPLKTDKLVRVLRPYEAALSDELTLVEGDVIYVEEEFDDDWAVGRNEATGEVGMFPMVCVGPLKTGSKSKSEKKNISTRGNSLAYSASVGL